MSKARQVEAMREQRRDSRPPARVFKVPMRPPTPNDLTTSALPGSCLGARIASANMARSDRSAVPTSALGLERTRDRCALCEVELGALAGVTYLKRVAEQRAQFGDAAMLRRCERRGVHKMYESAGLCVFCCQFFQEGWSDAV